MTGFIQAAEEKCIETGKTKRCTPSERVCGWKHTLKQCLREPLVAVLTLALLSLRGYAHFWHLTSDTLTATDLMEEERICCAL